MRGRIGRVVWDCCPDCQHMQPDSSCQHFNDHDIYIEKDIVYCNGFTPIEATTQTEAGIGGEDGG